MQHEHDYPRIDLLPLALSNGHRRMAEKLRTFEGGECVCGSVEVTASPVSRLTPKERGELPSLGFQLVAEAAP